MFELALDSTQILPNASAKRAAIVVSRDFVFIHGQRAARRSAVGGVAVHSGTFTLPTGRQLPSCLYSLGLQMIVTVRTTCRLRRLAGHQTDRSPRQPVWAVTVI